jgi:hypothetical protein
MTNYWETHGTPAEGAPETVGMDAFLPNVRMAERSGGYQSVVHGFFPPLPFADQSFDSVLLLEIVEHLEERKALDLIQEAKRVARCRVLLSTPNFPTLRPGHQTLTGFNDLEAHVSHLSRKHLRRLGFRLYGAGLRRGPRDWRRVLYRLNLLRAYDERFRVGLWNISYWFPLLAENVVGLWVRRP